MPGKVITLMLAVDSRLAATHYGFSAHLGESIQTLGIRWHASSPVQLVDVADDGPAVICLCARTRPRTNDDCTLILDTQPPSSLLVTPQAIA